MGSLTRRVREELATVTPQGVCCAWTELSFLAMIHGARIDERETVLRGCSLTLARRIKLLVRLVDGEAHPRKRPRARTTDMELTLPEPPAHTRKPPRRACCRGAALRALFWRGGYLMVGGHMELTPPPRSGALDLLPRLGVGFSTSTRNGRSVFYLKSQEEIARLLGRMGAFSTMLEYEDLLITKKLRNDVNRAVNCEVGNMRRTTRSSLSQIEDILDFQETVGLQNLPPKLADMAQARLKHPSASLRELGRLLRPKLTKSGAQHRLRELSRWMAKVRKLSANPSE